MTLPVEAIVHPIGLRGLSTNLDNCNLRSGKEPNWQCRSAKARANVHGSSAPRSLSN